MLLSQLFEYMNPSGMTAEVWDKIPNLIKTWAKDSLSDLLKITIPKQNEQVLRLEKARNEAYKNDDWKMADKLSDQFSNVSSEARDAFDKQLEPYEEQLWKELRQKIEIALQDIARNYMEETYGKIEPVRRGKNGDLEGNLYWLQHILVHIVTDATVDSGRDKGKPRTAGGYFAQYPSKDEFKDNISSKDIDWHNELAQGIVLYATKEQLWDVAKSALLDRLEQDWYGEAYGERHDVIPDFVKHIVDTFIHEVNHMYQATSRALEGPGRGTWSLGLLPDAEKGSRKASEMQKKNRGPDKWNKGNPAYRNYKAGKRGRPTRVPWKTGTDSSWAEYFGTIDEIDSHAMHTATDAVSEYYKELPRRFSSGVNQRELNQFIDDLIEDIKYGMSSHGSIRSYETYVRDKIKKLDDSLPASALPKVDILHRKVWRLFMSRLVRYLQTYKKDLPKHEWDEPTKFRPQLPD